VTCASGLEWLVRTAWFESSKDDGILAGTDVFRATAGRANVRERTERRETALSDAWRRYLQLMRHAQALHRRVDRLVTRPRWRAEIYKRTALHTVWKREKQKKNVD